MTNGSARQRKPRIRKSAPTVREKIESGAKEADRMPVKRSRSMLGVVFRPFAAIWRFIKPVLRPLAPVGRFLLKILRWLTPRYFVNSWRELKKVTWPNRKETWRLTAAVFIFAIVFGALIAVVDYGLDKVFKELVLK